jgi:nucleoside-diphosphate-sugar epimerase
MILVTGGTGFLGSRLLQELVGSGKEVRCLYRKSILKNVPVETAKYIDWQEADLLDVVSLEEVLSGVDRVYHCAGVVSFDPGNRKEMQAVNVTGTTNLVNACIAKGVDKLVHVSSVAALGRAAGRTAIDESCRWEDSRNNTAYALTKHLGEMEVWRGIGEGLKAVIVNPSILIGSSQSWDDASAGLIRNVYDEFPWYTKGVNGFVNVQDVTRAMVVLMEGDVTAERFILNGNNWSYQQLFATIHHHLGKENRQKYAAPWMGEIIWRLERLQSLMTRRPPRVTREMAKTARLKVYYDHSKIKRFLPGFEFTSLEKTIAETCSAFLQYKEKQNRQDESATKTVQHIDSA